MEYKADYNTFFCSSEQHCHNQRPKNQNQQIIKKIGDKGIKKCLCKNHFHDQSAARQLKKGNPAKAGFRDEVAEE